MALASVAMAQQQQHDPALTVADTCALLGTDFPTMREFGQQIGSSDPMFGSVTQQQQARSSENVAAGQYSPFSGDGVQQKLSVRSMQPGSAAPGAQQLQTVCKAEPASPVAGAGSWVPVSDWNGDDGPYDGFMGASLFGDACGDCGDMDADYGIDAASWHAADEDCFMHAELFQPVTTSVPAIRTLSVDSRKGCAGYGQHSLGAHCSEASEDTDLLQRTGNDSPVRSPASAMTCSASSSDASAITGATGYGAVVDGTCPSRSGGSCSLSSAPSNPASVAGPAVLSASQRCAADLMPAIGVGPIRRVPRLGAKPSDAELKETISALQRTTSRVPGSSDEAHTVSRAECLERYREKKLRRLDVNTIRYMKRKINADRRPRIKGRFVKAEELDAYRAGLLPGQNGIPLGL